MKHLLIFGYGYSARAIVRELAGPDWKITVTSRNTVDGDDRSSDDTSRLIFSGTEPSVGVRRALATVTHVLVCAPPGKDGDPVLAHHQSDFERANNLSWLGYLSTVGVYGNHDGAWVDEMTVPKPVSARSQARLVAEDAWQQLARDASIPLQIFRLAGIYGPGRGPHVKLQKGTSRRIVKSGQVFNRTHVTDIAGAVCAGLARSGSEGVFNVTDDLPAPPQDVISYAAELLGIDPPPEIAFEDADLTPMARSFYGENKRVKNEKLKSELGYALRFPTYREGLTNLLKAR